jgi:hypothetical protein
MSHDQSKSKVKNIDKKMEHESLAKVLSRLDERIVLQLAL